MPHFFTICNGGYDFWVCRYTSSSLTTWKFTEVRIHTHAHNFIWLLCFSNCKSLGPDYLRLFLIISRKYVGNNDSHSDPFGAKPMNASALLQRSSLMHMRPSKVQIKKKTCVSRLAARWSSNITNLPIDTLANKQTTVEFMWWCISVDAATFIHLVVCENFFWNLLVTFITDIAG